MDLFAEGISDVEFLAQCRKDVQKVCSRVLHHMHRRTTSGLVPLKSCQRKTKKGIMCKAGIPKPLVPKSCL
eukprot:2524152-Karenia_brevis.AAC.1